MKTIVKSLTSGSTAYEYIVEEGSEVLLILLCLSLQGDARVRIRLTGQNSTAEIIGLVVGDKNNSFALHTSQEHEAPGTTSNLLVKSVLSDTALFYYDGGITVAPNAQNTDAYQRNENLLLSEWARVESKPSLEILANDVRCTHGATVGSLPEDELWYMATRGISKEESTKLIVTGFFTGPLGKIVDSRIKNEIYRKLSVFVTL